MHSFPHPSAGHADLLSIMDLGADGIADVVEHALVLKAQAAAGIAVTRPLAGRHAALLFDKPSLRTRVSLEVGIHRLGGTTTTMSAADVGLGSREPRLNGKAPEGGTKLNGRTLSGPVGPIEQLDLSWRSPATAAATAMARFFRRARAVRSGG